MLGFVGHLSLTLQYESRDRQYVNDWVSVYSNETLYTKTGDGANLTHRLQFAEHNINIKLKFYIGASDNQIPYSVANETQNLYFTLSFEY